jgi:hypothetical protein
LRTARLAFLEKVK